MSLSLLLNSSSCLAEKADDSRAEMSLTPPEGESSSCLDSSPCLGRLCALPAMPQDSTSALLLLGR